MHHRTAATTQPVARPMQAMPRVVTPSPLAPPAGYRLVEDGMHFIGVRDLVFVGGMHNDWRPARRAGEAGSLRRDSVALGVASLVS